MSGTKINRAVYRLWHKRSVQGRIGYIGKDKYFPSRVQLERRKKDLSCPKLYRALNKYPVTSWFVDVLESDFKTDIEMSQAEIKFISIFDSKNKGYNLTDGGEGSKGYPKSPETRLKISKTKRDQKLHNSKKQKEAISRFFKGKKLSAEHCDKMRQARKGSKNYNWGKHLSPETRRKIRLSNTGLKRSPETVERIREAKRNQTAETRAKISAARTGHSVSTEQRKKISAALRRFHRRERVQ